MYSTTTWQDHKISIMSNNIIALLKSALPSIPECCPDLRKESSNSLCCRCPNPQCDSQDDAFVYRTDTETCFCRKCHPKGMDVLSFYKWRYGKKIPDLIREHLPSQGFNHTPSKRGVSNRSKTQNDKKDQRSRVQNEWRKIEDFNTTIKSNPLYDLLHGRRGIAKSTVKALHETGLLMVKNHVGKLSMAVPFKTLQGKVSAIQFLSVDETKFPFADDKRVFGKNHPAGSECFFMCGADVTKFTVQEKGIVILNEGVINAITAFEWFPNACCIALGGSTYTAKVKALKPYLEHVEKVIVCVDNDSASKKMLKEIWWGLK